MQKLWDWLIVGSLTLGVGVTTSFFISGGKTNSALLGSSTGAVLGAAISTIRQEKKQRDTLIRLKQLEERVAKQDEWEELNAKLPNLKAQVTELRKEQQELAKLEGQFVQKQAQLQLLEQRLTTLNQQREELERRIATINQQQPNLSTLEQLQVQIEQSRLDKSGLEGQINALRSQIESLEAQKRSLLHVESEFAAKKAQLELVNKQIQELQTKSQQLEQRAAELEQPLEKIRAKPSPRAMKQIEAKLQAWAIKVQICAS
ncbi:hypothetical protein SD81_027655 [Tolypothrix campylonemoides VB511288]|nr:hypothetical protein SD81_027655 [Tolypothrix campylonemoides VB511288]